ncbi:MAG: hypothetical protein PF489_00480 [Salinivirgaceae bacterium]|jgi:antitoxin component YwqK of YwqJK toxin-antitoxin module|nr:hypothetical protein [Salinivirgaceae bacterium]
MHIRTLIPLLLIVLTSHVKLAAQVYKLYEGDTINRVDVNTKKQGDWKYFHDNGKNISSEGVYVNNSKKGIWINYYENGNRKSEVTYKKGKPIGPAKFYYENGHVKETGTWLIKHWIGEYHYYYENGNPSYEFYFDAEGKRTGEQLYYYETGALMIAGDWKDGQKTGILTEFHEDGTVKNEKIFVDGEYKKGESKEYEPGVKEADEKFKQKSKKLLYTGNYRKTSPEGYLLQRGYFKDGELINGKWHFYDITGKRFMTKVLENKVVVDTIFYDGSTPPPPEEE